MALSKGPNGASATWRAPSCTSRLHPGRTDSTSLSPASWHFQKPWTLRSWYFNLCQNDLGVKSFHGDMSTAHFPGPLSSGPDGARFSGRDDRARDSQRQAGTACMEVLQTRVSFGRGHRALCLTRSQGISLGLGPSKGAHTALRALGPAAWLFEA